MDNYSAQNSITVKRLRNGDTFFISFGNNGIPLYQGVDPVTGVVAPSWGTGTGQVTPIITPQVTSARGNSVTLGSHQWSYNGLAMNFSGSTVTIGGVVYTKASNDGRFAMASTGALAIIGDLASTTNIASDSLTYSCIATVAGVEYALTKSVDIQIQSIGASSYYGTINASSEQLTASVTQTTVKTALYLGGTVQNSYYVKWYKDDTHWSEKLGQTQITITRADVDGTQLFIAEFYKSQADYEGGADPIFRAGIRIIDTLDDYHVEHRYVNSDGTTTGTPNREVDTGKPVYLKAYVVNVRTNTELTTISGSWVSHVMDPDGWVERKRVPASGTNTGATNLVSVTVAETDINGVEKDAVVVSEVEWTM